MRKLSYAGAVIAGGIFLFGASPAQADLLPGTGTAEQQTDEQLARMLGQSDGVSLSNPLGYSSLQDTAVGKSPLMQVKPGQNTPNVTPVLPGEHATEPQPELPAADVVGGTLRQNPASVPARPLPVRKLPVGELPVRDLIGGGLPLLGGLLPGGLLPDGRTPDAGARPTTRQAELFDGGMPLLGGLGGVLPPNTLRRDQSAGDSPDTTGLPAGGTTVVPAAAPGTAPASPLPGAAEPKPRPAATPDDPRLHEEPIDGEASRRRPFSPDGRPIAGIDPEYG